MKKKYVAVILGLVLSMSTSSVYAAGVWDYYLQKMKYNRQMKEKKYLSFGGIFVLYDWDIMQNIVK